MNIFNAWMNSAESLQGQLDILDQYVCQDENTPDPAGCKLGAETWWPAIVEVIFSDEHSPIVCHAINNECRRPHPKLFTKADVWDCTACELDLKIVAELFKKPETENSIVGHLKGPAFCGSLDVDNEGLAFCHGAIERFVPAALKTLFTYLEYNLQGACHTIYDGICPAPESMWF